MNTSEKHHTILTNLRHPRRWLPTIIALAVAAAFLVFLLTRFEIDLAATWHHIRSANPWLLAAAFPVHYTTYLFRGARWRILLEQQAQTSNSRVPSTLYCSQLILLGWFVNSIQLAPPR